MPTGMLQISGQEIYKQAIMSHNAYLEKFETFPMYEIFPEEMSTLRPSLLESPHIHRILKTKSSTTHGRWLIETTKIKMHHAKTHCEQLLQTIQTDPESMKIPSLLDPDLADDDMLLMSKELENQYNTSSPMQPILHQNDKRLEVR